VRRAASALALLLAVGCSAPSRPSATAEGSGRDAFPAAVAAVKPSVVLFRMRIPSDDPKRKGAYDDAYGTGFVVAGGGRRRTLVLTVAHVVDQARGLRVVLDDRRTFPARAIAVEVDRDIALVAIAVGGMPPVRFARGRDAALGTAVGIAGYPIPDAFEDERLGVGLSVFGGRIAGLRRGALELDVPVIPGESGGPIFLARTGEVVGLAESRFDEERAIGFAVPVEAVRRFLARHAPPIS